MLLTPETLLLRKPQRRQSYTNARERIFHLQVIVNTLDRDLKPSRITQLLPPKIALFVPLKFFPPVRFEKSNSSQTPDPFSLTTQLNVVSVGEHISTDCDRWTQRR